MPPINVVAINVLRSPREKETRGRRRHIRPSIRSILRMISSSRMHALVHPESVSSFSGTCLHRDTSLHPSAVYYLRYLPHSPRRSLRNVTVSVRVREKRQNKRKDRWRGTIGNGRVLPPRALILPGLPQQRILPYKLENHRRSNDD